MNLNDKYDKKIYFLNIYQVLPQFIITEKRQAPSILHMHAARSTSWSESKRRARGFEISRVLQFWFISRTHVVLCSVSLAQSVSVNVSIILSYFYPFARIKERKKENMGLKFLIRFSTSVILCSLPASGDSPALPWSSKIKVNPLRWEKIYTRSAQSRMRVFCSGLLDVASSAHRKWKFLYIPWI